MDWARRRKWTVIILIAAFCIAVLCIIGFAIFYKTPTCTDLKQDGNETGIDCGGSCSTVCSIDAAPASVRFVRTLNQSGRTDLIAYIDNPNQALYTKDTHLTIEVYGTNDEQVTRHISLTLLPGAATPLFIPGVGNGSVVRQAFVTFDSGYPVWIKSPFKKTDFPVVSDTSIDTTSNTPHLTATLSNQTAYQLQNIPVIATVFGSDGSAIAASQTVLQTLPAQGTASVIFTWNEPFSDTPARVEVLPIISLPAPLP